jgi:hypothetical protein
LFVAALLTVFSGLLSHVAHLLLGTAEKQAAGLPTPFSCVAAMGLLIAVLTVFSVWLPKPLFRLITQAAGIVRGIP